MRVLVTGAQGTLGQPLVHELRARGHEVIATGRRHGEDILRMDITLRDQVRAVFIKYMPAVCVHLGGEFGRLNGEAHPASLWMANCLGTSNIAYACSMTHTHLIFASSSEAYGCMADEGELREDMLIADLPDFHNEYALTKFTNEQQIRIAIWMRKLRATILRFFNVYGPGERYTPYRSVICQFAYRALRNLPVTVYTGSSRSFLYIDDWTHAVANVCTTEMPNGEAYNIASPTSYQMDVVWGMVREITGSKSQVTLVDAEPHNVRDKRASVEKAARAFGLRDTVELREGIERTVAWVREEYGL